MKMIKDSHGRTSVIGRDEASVFNKVAMRGFLAVSSMSEREHHLADQLHTRNILQKVKRHGHDGYKIYPQINQV